MPESLNNFRLLAVRIVEGETILPPEKADVLKAARREHQSLVDLVETLRRRKAAAERIVSAGAAFDDAIEKQAEVVREKQASADGRKLAPFLGVEAWRELDTLFLAANDVQKSALEAIAAAHQVLGETADLSEAADPDSDPYDWKQAKVA